MTEQNVMPNNDRSAHISLDAFYADILPKKFNTSVEAIDYCRKLCAQFGFTIKQEQSTYRNIYVYCSREGFPDSLRNPKSNPKRRRPSKRCDCKWRITLNEQNGNLWEFRKSLNPDASKHNHELMRPEEIDSGWPKEMLDLISDLTRQRMTTPEIRSRVQVLYAHIPWNERRFYNRLSEERQKLRVADTQARVQQLQAIWSNLVTASAASQELTDLAVNELHRMVDQLCGITQTDPTILPSARVTQQHADPELDPDMDDDLGLFSSQDAGGDSSQDESSKPSVTTRRQGNASVTANTPKGYTAVVIPQQVYYVKLHPQRVLQDVQQLNRRRSRSFAFSDAVNTNATDTSPAPSSSSSLSNQQKKQKTPMFMEMAQHHQQQQQQPPIMPSGFGIRQTKPHPQQDLRYLPHQLTNMPINEHPPPPVSSSSSSSSSITATNFMYPPPTSQRDSTYYASTLYPTYPQQPTQRFMTGQHQPQPPQHYQQEYHSRVDHDALYATSTTGLAMTANHHSQPTTTTTSPPSSSSSSSSSSQQQQHHQTTLRNSPVTSFDPSTTPTPNHMPASQQQSLHALPPPPTPMQPDYMSDQQQHHHHHHHHHQHQHHVQPSQQQIMHPSGYSSFPSSRVYYDPNNLPPHPGQPH